MQSILTQATQKLSYALRFYRRAQQLSQTDLAHNAGLSFRNYQRLENGEALPRVETLIRLAREFAISPATLLECPDDEAIGFSEVSTKEDLEIIEHLKKEVTDKVAANPGKIVVNTKQLSAPQDFVVFEIQGKTSEVPELFREKFQIGSAFVDLDQHLLGIKSIDIWETIARRKLKCAKTVNLLKLPSGLHFIETFHHIISASPDNTQSICYARDCTNQYDLREWVLEMQRKSLMLYPETA